MSIPPLSLSSILEPNAFLSRMVVLWVVLVVFLVILEALEVEEEVLEVGEEVLEVVLGSCRAQRKADRQKA